MTFLVDANVLSEPTKPAPSGKVIDWLSAHEANCVVDPIILGELCIGILGLPRGRKRAQLEVWFDAVVTTVACLPWDTVVSRRWAQLVVDLRAKGQSMRMHDAMIAATALAHDLTVVTRNVRDFKKSGVKIIDPFGSGSVGK
jgi:predicted nucleic acid-binding protein